MRFVWLNFAAFKAKLDAKRLAYEPLRKAVTQSVADIAAEARSRAPRDRGELQGSLKHENDGAWPVMTGHAGSDARHAPFLDYGTGAFAEGPIPGKGTHHPPPKYLHDWAERHGFGPNGGYIVSRIISRRAGARGGLHPRRYLRDAVEAMRPKVAQNFNEALTEIKRNWEA